MLKQILLTAKEGLGNAGKTITIFSFSFSIFSDLNGVTLIKR